MYFYLYQGVLISYFLQVVDHLVDAPFQQLQHTLDLPRGECWAEPFPQILENNQLSFQHFHLPLLPIGEVQRPEILIGDRVCVSGERVEALHHDLLQDFRVGD